MSDLFVTLQIDLDDQQKIQFVEQFISQLTPSSKSLYTFRKSVESSRGRSMTIEVLQSVLMDIILNEQIGKVLITATQGNKGIPEDNATKK